LHAHGPATREDFARWWGVQPAPAGRILKRLGDQITEVSVEGEAMWMLSADAEAAAGVGGVRTIRLLPGFDQYVIVSNRQAEHLMPPGDFRPLVFRKQGWISAVVLVDGRIEGVWRYERRGRRVSVDVEHFAGDPKPKVRRAIEKESERVAAWLAP
jgi:hypothetical protein